MEMMTRPRNNAMDFGGVTSLLESLVSWLWTAAWCLDELRPGVWLRYCDWLGKFKHVVSLHFVIARTALPPLIQQASQSKAPLSNKQKIQSNTHRTQAVRWRE